MDISKKLGGILVFTVTEGTVDKGKEGKVYIHLAMEGR